MFKRSYSLFLVFGTLVLCLVLFPQTSCSDDNNSSSSSGSSSSIWSLPDFEPLPNYSIRGDNNKNSQMTISGPDNQGKFTINGIVIIDDVSQSDPVTNIDSVIVYMEYRSTNEVETIIDTNLSTLQPGRKKSFPLSKVIDLSSCTKYKNGEYMIHVLVLKKEESGQYVYAIKKSLPFTRENSNCTTYSLNVKINPPEGGTFTLNPPGDSYSPGDVVNITQSASSGYKFIGWSTETIDYNRTKSSLQVVFDIYDIEVTAKFAESKNLIPIKFSGSETVTLNADGRGIDIKGERIFDNNCSASCDVYRPGGNNLTAGKNAKIIDKFEVVSRVSPERIDIDGISSSMNGYSENNSYTTDLFITSNTAASLPIEIGGYGQYYVIQTLGYSPTSANKWSNWFLVYVKGGGSSMTIKAWKVQ